VRTGAAGLATIAALAAPPVLAHPHLFIDTGIEVIFDDQGRASALRISWTYDKSYSLTLVRDRGIDPDGDGEATPAEIAALTGFDMNRATGTSGDTYALAGDTPLHLGRPRDWTASYHGGHAVSTHVRDIDPPVDPAAAMLVMQSFDPGFYRAYTIASDPVLTGRRGCTAQVFAPDLDETDPRAQAALAEHGEDEDAEIEFPAIGAANADEIRVTCADPS
jgi:polyphosphate kinase